MLEVTVAEAKAKLSDLIQRAEKGEEIAITRRGKLVVVMSAPKKSLPDRTLLRLKQIKSKTASVEHIRAMRDDE